MTARTLCTAALLASIGLLTGCDFLGGGQRSYATPDEAVDALQAAVQSGETRAMLRVLGEEAEPLIESGDPVQDTNSREEFAAKLAEKRALTTDGADRATLVAGADEWPFPFPLVRDDAGWHFDATSAADEIVDRRIGENELSTIQVCLAYVDAQIEYYVRNPEGDALLHYARGLISQPGRKDGLYWEAADGEPPSPVGELLAEARGEGYLREPIQPGQPYHGYYYRTLQSQGPDAAGGAYDYLVGERLIGGFALLAYPAERGSSGVVTFIVNHDGAVFSKDLGPDTAALAAQITSFNPDSTWKREGT